MYKHAEASFWTAEEIDLSGDLKHWDNTQFLQNTTHSYYRGSSYGGYHATPDTVCPQLLIV